MQMDLVFAPAVSWGVERRAMLGALGEVCRIRGLVFNQLNAHPEMPFSTWSTSSSWVWCAYVTHVCFLYYILYSL